MQDAVHMRSCAQVTSERADRVILQLCLWSCKAIAASTTEYVEPSYISHDVKLTHQGLLRTLQ